MVFLDWPRQKQRAVQEDQAILQVTPLVTVLLAQAAVAAVELLVVATEATLLSREGLQRDRLFHKYSKNPVVRRALRFLSVLVVLVAQAKYKLKMVKVIGLVSSL
jgi:hypothetical protein